MKHTNMKQTNMNHLHRISQWIFLILLALSIAGCGSESGNTDNNSYLSFSIRTTQAHDTLDSIIVTIREQGSGSVVNSGDILASGGTLTLRVPPHVDLTVAGQGFIGTSLEYDTLTPTVVPALRPNETRANIAFSMEPVGGGAAPSAPISVQPGNGATGVSINPVFTVDISSLANDILEVGSVNLVLRTSGEQDRTLVPVLSQGPVNEHSFSLAAGDNLTPLTQYSATFSLNYLDQLENSQTFTYPWNFTTTPTIDSATFPDTNLQACVRRQNDFNQMVYLSEITSLSCVWNSITSIEGIDQLYYMQNLYLHNCGEGCSRDFDANDISDLSPLVNMPNLITVDIQMALANTVTNLDDLRNAQGIQTLRLEDNFLENIDAVTDIPALTSLNVSDNSISTVNIFGDHTNLTTLTLDRNMVSNFSISGNMPTLSRIALNDNQLSQQNSVAFSGNFPQLSDLELSGNGIVNAPDLSALTAINFIDLSGNLISDVNQFSTHTGWLDLSNNRVSDIVVGSLPNITGLNLSFNDIVSFSMSGDAPNLDTLYLDNNRIRNISFTGDVSSLNRLSLANNAIKDPSPLQFLTSLTNLGLANNLISDVSSLSGLTSLQNLSLFNNNIQQGLNLIQVSGGTNARLWLNGNLAMSCADAIAVDARLDGSNGLNQGIVRWDTTCFTDQTLASLNFTDTQLASCVNASGVTNVSELSSLNCGFQGITDLTGIEQLPFLSSLFLQNNAIANFGELRLLRGLTTLTLDNTNLSTSTAYTGVVSLKFTGFKGLENLRLEVNPFTSISAEFREMVWLRNLHLSDSALDPTLFNNVLGPLYELYSIEIIDMQCSSDPLLIEIQALDDTLDDVGEGGDGPNAGIVQWSSFNSCGV